jgi:hypothetical protein
MIKSGGHAVFPELQQSFETTSALIQWYTKGAEGEGMGEHIVELSESSIYSASVPCLLLVRKYIGFNPVAHAGVKERVLPMTSGVCCLIVAQI